MTIKELIAALSGFDPNLPVVVRDYESGYNNLTVVKAKAVQMNVNTEHYYGAHGTTDSHPVPVPNVPMTNVVYLDGYNHIAND